MASLVKQYLEHVYARLEAMPDFPGALERSTTRIFTVDDPPTLTLHRDREEVDEGSPLGRADRTRTVGATVHAAGPTADDDAEEIFEILQPIIIGMQVLGLPGLVSVTEIGTAAPKYPNQELGRFQVTRYFKITYQTADTSLSE